MLGVLSPDQADNGPADHVLILLDFVAGKVEKAAESSTASADSTQEADLDTQRLESDVSGRL